MNFQNKNPSTATHVCRKSRQEKNVAYMVKLCSKVPRSPFRQLVECGRTKWRDQNCGRIKTARKRKTKESRREKKKRKTLTETNQPTYERTNFVFKLLHDLCPQILNHCIFALS